MRAAAATAGFPGVLYDGDGTHLAGDGSELTPELTDSLPFKALIRNTPGGGEVALLQVGDRLWLLPDDGFGSPPELSMMLLTTLANMLLFDDSGGRA